MAENRITWDNECIADSIRSIRSESVELESQIGFLEGINKTIEGAWKGDAGAVFDLFMDIDTALLKMFMQQLENLTNDLQKTVSDAYGAAEDAVKAELQKLNAKV